MSKINFILSLSSFTGINRYAKELNLSIQTVTRFLLTEQLHCYEHTKELFNSRYKKCKYKDSKSRENDYGKEKCAKEYTMEVSEYIYEGIQNLKREYNQETNKVINNLLHMAIREKLNDFNSQYATDYYDLKPNTKQYSIPLSSEFTLRLEDISKQIGISVNKLISLIIGNYLIEHFSDYDDNYYISEDGKTYHSIW